MKKIILFLVVTFSCLSPFCLGQANLNSSITQSKHNPIVPPYEITLAMTTVPLFGKAASQAITLAPGQDLIVYIKKQANNWHNSVSEYNSPLIGIFAEFKTARNWFQFSPSPHHLMRHDDLNTDEDPMSYHFTATTPGTTTLYFEAIGAGLDFLEPELVVTVIPFTNEF